MIAARRVAQTAAHLVDEVLPHVPLRQWVLAAPFDLHHRLARDAALAKAALAVFIGEIERFLYGAVADGEAQLTGAADAPFLGEGRRARARFFTATQAFGSALNLQVHWHVLGADGLYEQQADGTLRFLRAAAATHEELTSVVQRVAARVRALVGEAEDTEAIVQARVLKVLGAKPREAEEPSRAVQHDGFNLHANVAFAANERVAVERLCRYMLRGPLASGCLRRGRGDKLIYDPDRPRGDGTTQLVLSPMALLQRLSWLCVPPTRSPARAPDQLDAWNTRPPTWADAEPPPDCDELPPPFEYDQRVPETDVHVS